MKREFGDYPVAALAAMSRVDDAPWAAQAIAALKEARPTTEEAAAEIVDTFHRAHVASLYEPYGELPADVPGNALFYLEHDVPESRRGQVLRMLREAPRPLDDAIATIAHAGGDADDESADDEDPQLEERTDTRGHKQPARRAKSSPPDLIVTEGGRTRMATEEERVDLGDVAAIHTNPIAAAWRAADEFERLNFSRHYGADVLRLIDQIEQAPEAQPEAAEASA
jgi:hypothetical protein